LLALWKTMQIKGETLAFWGKLHPSAALIVRHLRCSNDNQVGGAVRQDRAAVLLEICRTHKGANAQDCAQSPLLLS
jgi:hypothetical protein